MAQRHKRKPEITDLEQQRFVSEATAYHGQLTRWLRELKPGCDHYNAVSSLHRELIAALRAVTGEDPPWMKVAPGRSQ